MRISRRSPSSVIPRRGEMERSGSACHAVMLCRMAAAAMAVCGAEWITGGSFVEVMSNNACTARNVKVPRKRPSCVL